MLKKICKECRKRFLAFEWEVKRGGGKYCNPSCFYKSRKGKRHSNEQKRKMSISMRIAKAKTKVPIADRFFKFVDKSQDGCWNWKGGLYHHGYGAFSDANRKPVRAHRFSYELHKGKIPKGLTIDHLCKNTSCVNPEHLEAVTIKVNVLRSDSFVAINARKTECKRGHDIMNPENYYRTKLGGRACKICSKTKGKQTYQMKKELMLNNYDDLGNIK